MFVERLGGRAIAQWCELVAVTVLVGGQMLRIGDAMLGRARMRRVDFLGCMYDAGIAALPMVALVNVLVGAILAFVGAIELRRFGADIYIANLVGLAQVREMAAVMTAIVMSGRTGGAYAAEIASMQGSNELDALRVLGIPLQDYLVHLYNDTKSPYSRDSVKTPVPAEFTNWRSGQKSWRESAILFDQSHHMPELFVKGPEALRLRIDLLAHQKSRAIDAQRRLGVF